MPRITVLPDGKKKKRNTSEEEEKLKREKFAARNAERRAEAAKSGLTKARTAEEIKAQFPQGVPTAQGVSPDTGNVFINKEGRAAGLKNVDGRTFLGLSPDDVKNILNNRQARNPTVQGEVGGQETSGLSELERVQQAAALEQVGALEPFPIEEKPIVPQDATSRRLLREQQLEQGANEFVDKIPKNVLPLIVIPSITESFGIGGEPAAIEQTRRQFIKEVYKLSGRVRTFLTATQKSGGFVADLSSAVLGNEREQVRNQAGKLEKKDEMITTIMSSKVMEPQAKVEALERHLEDIDLIEREIQARAIANLGIQQSDMLEPIQTQILKLRQKLLEAIPVAATSNMGIDPAALPNEMITFREIAKDYPKDV